MTPKMNAMEKGLSLYIPHGLIIYWSASNFLNANKLEYFDLSTVFIFYCAFVGRGPDLVCFENIPASPSRRIHYILFIFLRHFFNAIDKGIV